MSAALEVVECGRGHSVQDAGRPGWQNIGVPEGGALDPWLLACANRIAGNPPDAAGIELRASAMRLAAVGGDVVVAIAGSVTCRVARRGRPDEAASPWRGVVLREGDSVRIDPPRRGTAYLACAGGIATAPTLGSRSTYVPARLGGVAGCELARGDLLPTAAGDAGSRVRRRAAPPFEREVQALRIMRGPQDDHFATDALATLCGNEYVVTPALDRMGVRLDGAAIAHRTPSSADIVSDGTAPGAIQVPADGRPIVLMADCQTVGGYAKIATVIRADLARLAHAVPGDTVRFAEVDRARAEAAWREERVAWTAWSGRVRLDDEDAPIESARLLSVSLVAGVVAGRRGH